MNITRNSQISSNQRVALGGLVLLLTFVLVAFVGVHGSEKAVAQGGTDVATESPTASCIVAYSYDDAGRLLGVNYDSRAGISYSYDASGNMVGISAGEGHRVYLPIVLRSR